MLQFKKNEINLENTTVRRVHTTANLPSEVAGMLEELNTLIGHYLIICQSISIWPLNILFNQTGAYLEIGWLCLNGAIKWNWLCCKLL